MIQKEDNLKTEREVDERLSALITNSAAIRAIAGAVENTIGPKGLDTMLVDGNGNIIVTNAGVTILEAMEVTHPAARMVINIARNQHKRAGDGTTTATIMAAALVTEGLNQIIKGVPVGKIIDGINIGINEALRILDEEAIKITDLEDPLLKKAVMIAGRGDEEITDAITSVAKEIGYEKLLDRAFKLADRIICQPSADNELFKGLIIKKRRVNEHMPEIMHNANILLLDDALMPEELSESAMKTEAGFTASVEKQKIFRDNLNKLISAEVGVVIINKGMDSYTEDFLTRSGIMAFSRVPNGQFTTLSEFIDAKPIRRTVLELTPEEIRERCGFVSEIKEIKESGQLRLSGGRGKKSATFIAGASTEEIAEEKERIARDAAASLQSALKEGVVAGGGSFELSLIPALKKLREKIKDLSAYGVDSVIESLKRPMSQILTNAGFNALEKLELVTGTINEKGGYWGIDCESGELTPMLDRGILDPAIVKKYALTAAKEVAQSILKINTIIRMKNVTNYTNYM